VARKKRGRFICFEGAEAVGKSTQIELLRSALEDRGLPVFCTREPGGTPVGEDLRRILKTQDIHARTEVFVVLASRAEHVAKEILPRLARGEIVICDRFQESTFVYQGLRHKFPLKTLREMNRFATQGLQPDLIIWLDLPASDAQKRLQGRASHSPDRFDESSIEFHQKIVRGYQQLARIQKRPRLQHFKALQSPQELHGQILKSVEKLIKK